MKAFCINLDHRPDRWESSQDLLKDFDVERFSAIRRTPGWEGCRESHLSVLRKITEFPTAVFEDDLDFISPIEIIYKAIEQAGRFDMLYLGCDPQEPMKRAGENLLRLKSAYQTHAIIYGSKRVVDYILNNNPPRKIDVFYSENVLPRFKCYTTCPMVAKQANGHSDITNRKVTFDYIEEKYNSMII